VTKVSGPLNPGADVFEFKWSPDSTRLAYLADQHMDGFPELFMAAAQGGSSAQVSNTFPVNGSVLAYAWAPDGSRIAYLANQDENAVPEVFSALAAGGGNVQVSGAMVPGGYVSSNGLGGTLVDEAPFAWAADGSRIAYLATQDDATVLELYTSLPAGGGNVKVNAPLAPETLILPQVYAFAWSPDSTRLAYAANQESNLRGEVFTAGPDGSGNTKVFVATWDGGFAMHPTWSSDGERIAGWANNIGFSEGLAFAGPALAPVGPTSVLCEHFAWSPGADALAIAVEEGVGVAPAAEVYGPTGFTPVSSLANGETVSADTLAWAPDGSRVAFCTADLHVSFPTTEYGSERISPTLHGTDRSVRKFQWAPDSLRLVFTADIAAAEKIELFISPRDAASRTVLSPPLVFGGQVLDFEVR
jgi:Tol biopolymer transport system component